MKKSIGKNTLGSGGKMEVDLKTFNRSTHDLSSKWRSSAAAGTLIPFMNIPTLPGDTFDIRLDCDVMTHPTLGPLFGSYKVQLDVFEIPQRLYQGMLLQNMLGVGNEMETVVMPKIRYTVNAPGIQREVGINDQTNPSSLLRYLGISGVGVQNVINAENILVREFNGVPMLGYGDIYKQYYANKEEENGYFIHTPSIVVEKNIVSVSIAGSPIQAAPASGSVIWFGGAATITFTAGTAKTNPEYIIFNTNIGEISLASMYNSITVVGDTYLCSGQKQYSTPTIYNWNYIQPGTNVPTETGIEQFPLTQLDQVRRAILISTPNPLWVDGNAPYNRMLGYDFTNKRNPMQYSQEGLFLKTYQSDCNNSWVRTTWVNTINSKTAINVSGGLLNMNDISFYKKAWEMLNAIAVSGGTYEDYIQVNYGAEPIRMRNYPSYVGGLSKELVFQEVVGQAAAVGQGQAAQIPQGTITGKGILSGKHKGGQIRVKCEEYGYLMGIFSLTPRVEYAGFNAWHTNIRTMADWHTPYMDGIAFQDKITEEIDWRDTAIQPGTVNVPGSVIKRSAGKQPAWINYQTAVDELYGNFAEPNNEAFMTLWRRYDFERIGSRVTDITSYIDPAKYNYIFAQTSIDSQNFWVSINKEITARRVMSAKIMPNI